MEYPIIRIPQTITNIRNSHIPYPPEPPTPIAPKKKNPTRLIIVIPVVLIAVFVIMLISSKNQELFIPLTNSTTTDGRKYSLGINGFHIFFALTPFIFYVFFAHKRSNLEKEYKSALLIYERNHVEYKTELANHLKKIEELNKDENVNAYRNELTRQYFKSSSEPDILQREVNRGKYEELFFNHLSRHFCSIIYNNLQLGYFEYAYVSDFTYCSVLQNIYIDIEIDEPYVMSTGEPIHFVGKDNSRDLYFNNQGWSVIRFSEKQVAKYPNKCCEQLEILINHLRHNSPLKIIVERDNQWTKSDAEDYYSQKLRNKY